MFFLCFIGFKNNMYVSPNTLNKLTCLILVPSSQYPVPSSQYPVWSWQSPSSDNLKVALEWIFAGRPHVITWKSPSSKYLQVALD